MVMARTGEVTGGTVVKPELPENLWQIRTSADSADAVDNRKLPPQVTADIVLQVRQ